MTKSADARATFERVLDSDTLTLTAIWAVISAGGILAVIALAAFLALCAALLAWKAFALAVLWQWFFIPLGAPPIGMPVMAGILLFLNLIRPVPDAAPEKTKASAAARFSVKALGPAIFLAFGWAFHLWM